MHYGFGERQSEFESTFAPSQLFDLGQVYLIPLVEIFLFPLFVFTLLVRLCILASCHVT